MSLKTFNCLVIFVVCIMLAGCGEKGPKRNAVKGTVKYKNEPVKAGSINFRSKGEESFTGSADITDGRYEITQQVGLPAGNYDIAISYPDPSVPTPKGDEAPGVAPPQREMLPQKYNENSELKREIKAGVNQLDFDLK